MAKLLVSRLFKQFKSMLLKDENNWYISANLNRAEIIKYNHGWQLTIKAAEGKCFRALGEKLKRRMHKKNDEQTETIKKLKKKLKEKEEIDDINNRAAKKQKQTRDETNKR